MLQHDADQACGRRGHDAVIVVPIAGQGRPPDHDARLFAKPGADGAGENAQAPVGLARLQRRLGPPQHLVRRGQHGADRRADGIRNLCREVCRDVHDCGAQCAKRLLQGGQDRVHHARRLQLMPQLAQQHLQHLTPAEGGGGLVVCVLPPGAVDADAAGADAGAGRVHDRVRRQGEADGLTINPRQPHPPATDRYGRDEGVQQQRPVPRRVLSPVPQSVPDCVSSGRVSGRRKQAGRRLTQQVSCRPAQ